MPVRRCQTATKFKQTPDGMLVPTFPSDPNGQAMTLMDVPPEKLQCPDIIYDDYATAL